MVLIQEFLNRLQDPSQLRERIRKEMEEPEMKKLLSNVITENNTLQELKECFDIKVNNEGEISVKVTKIKAIKWTPSE